MHSVEDILGRLREVSRMIQDIHIDQDGKEDAITALVGIIELCGDVQQVAIKHDIELRKQPRTERQMTNFIVREIEAQPMKAKVSNKEVSAGGEKAAALRRAGGKCELCGAEWNLSCHHIIPRDSGGLTEPENIIVLCKRCHDEIEPLDLQTREAILRYDRTRDSVKQPASSNGKTSAEKAAETRAIHLAEERAQEAELSAWAAAWDGMFSASVQYKHLADPEVKRPEKPWHVIVYGGGRASFETLRKSSVGATS